MKTVVHLQHAFKIAAGAYFLDKKARSQGVAMLEAPFFSTPFAAADQDNGGEWSDVLESDNHYCGTVLVNPDCVDPGSRSNYVMKKVFANRPIFDAAACTTFVGTGANDGLASCVAGDDFRDGFRVPMSYVQTHVMASGCSHNVKPNADGSALVVSIMPTAAIEMAVPNPAQVEICKCVEDSSWRSPDASYIENARQNLKVGLGAIAVESLTFWDEPDGPGEDMDDHAAPWNDQGGGTVATWPILNQWEVGKGMRGKASKRGIEHTIEGRDFEDLGRTAIDWFNEVYDYKTGEFAAAMGMTTDGAVKTQSGNESDRAVGRNAAYNVVLRDLALKFLAIVAIYDRYDQLSRYHGSYDVRDLLWTEDCDSSKCAALKAMLASSSTSGVRPSFAENALSTLYANIRQNVSGDDWTSPTIAKASGMMYMEYMTRASALQSISFFPVTEPGAAYTGGEDKIPVASFYGKQRSGTWAGNATKLTCLSDFYWDNAWSPSCLCAQAVKTDVPKAIYNSSGVRVATDMTDPREAYTVASRLLVGEADGYVANNVNAMFEDKINTDTEDWSDWDSGCMIWWWMCITKGRNR